MKLKLAKDETIIKTYNYSEKKVKSKGQKETPIQNNLIVTNMRIINESVSDKTILRKEIPIQAADYVNSAFAASGTSLLFAIIAAAVGILCFILGAVVSPFIFLLGILFVLFAAYVFITHFLKQGATVIVEISGKMGEHNLLSMGSSSIATTNKIKKLKITVNKNEAQDMINELGALIMDIKSLNTQVEPGQSNQNTD